MTDDTALKGRLEEAIAHINAPDTVLAVTRRGERTVISGGTRPAPATPREDLRYELGSISKTFTALLLADLAHTGIVHLDDPLTTHLPDLPGLHLHSRAHRITLRHLATHTSGLPRIPRDLLLGALTSPHRNSYADYDTERLLRTFATTRILRRPGTHWRYSNFGAALLGTALAHTTGTAYPTLLEHRVLHPLSLTSTGTASGTTGTDAVGHRPDGRPVPPSVFAGFVSCGGIRATPNDLLTYLEAHLTPHHTPLNQPLTRVQTPELHQGRRNPETHTLTWIQHPAPRGPLLFHAGATFGQQAFLGYHPATHTALAATTTRHGRTCPLVTTAYNLLHELCDQAAPNAR
ncbi:serine hydrolase domain-containing protein [Streptomyces sp. NPDC056161]|uniref:serine hydrolase domain-containing protein n=1 Tax=Streptomyces sp. NPDC056161 TaxID=3345732 RepID=UPI0035DA2B3F